MSETCGTLLISVTGMNFPANYNRNLMMIMQMARAGETNITYHLIPNTYVSLVKLQYMSIYG